MVAVLRIQIRISFRILIRIVFYKILTVQFELKYQKVNLETARSKCPTEAINLVSAVAKAALIIFQPSYKIISLLR